jgi:hypothetical protein
MADGGVGCWRVVAAERVTGASCLAAEDVAAERRASVEPVELVELVGTVRRVGGARLISAIARCAAVG